MSDFTEKISVIDKQIASIQANIPGLIPAEAAWRLQSQEPCNQKLKNKRATCQADKQFKLGRANSIKETISNYRTQIVQLNKTKATLVASQKAKDEATINLSTTGQSLEALVIKADAEASAIKNSSEIEAQAEASAIRLAGAAEATAIQQQATVDADASKQMNMVVLIIIIVVALIAVGFGVMKLKNAKKKSKK